jgi:hypothetical protein
MSFVCGASTVPSAKTLKEDVGVLMGIDVFCALRQVAREVCANTPSSEEQAMATFLMVL